MAISFSKQIIEQLLFETRWRREGHQLHQACSIEAFGMNTHDQVQEPNPVWSEFFYVDIRALHLLFARFEFLLLFRQSKCRRHSFVSDVVREQMLPVGHTFHQHDGITWKRL